MARREFEPEAKDVRAARHFAATEAANWGVDSADLEIVVAELAANAFLHARTPFTVCLCHVDGNLTVEVADGSRSLPMVNPMVSVDIDPGLQETGRGLLMVETVALAWGARSAPGGKIVWAELPAVDTDIDKRVLR